MTTGSRRLEGQVAAITAATRSIGRAIAERFLAEGASVVVNGRDVEKGARCLAEMNAGDRASFYAGSAAEQSVVEGLVDYSIQRYGRLDIMVCNAGGILESAPVVSMSDAEWKYEFDININHTFWATRRALQHMVPRGSGRIIAMSSIEGKHAKPGIAGYNANKHAINGFVKAVAREVGTNAITVNAICPGLVVTDVVHERAGRTLGTGGVDGLIELFTKDSALKRPVTVQEVAALAAFLASADGSGITGATLSVDGGAAFY